MPSRRSLILGAALLIGGVLLGALATGGTADLASLQSQPADPVRPDTRAATGAEVAAAGLKGMSPQARGGGGKLTLRAQISRQPVVTPEGTSEFVGLTCPEHYTAVSGGALTGYTNLLMSQSAPIRPRTGRYTPRTWWVAVTNFSVDGSHANLPWFPVVNCMNKINVKR
jgi:hypothetical protein